MRVPYFPGCTLYGKAKGLDFSTRASLAALGVDLAELPQWTCCGAVFPLARDNYMGMVAAARILADAARVGGNLLTVCSFCYNVLKQVNYEMQNNLEARNKLNDYLEDNYTGEIHLIHPLEVCKQHVGFDVINNRTVHSLKGLKVACYYGCTLVRPASRMDFDDPDNPTIMEDLVTALGAEAVDYNNKTTCCGSYQVLHQNDLVMERVRDILESATAKGAEVIITSCPLCQFNLDRMQEKIMEDNGNFCAIPVLYFTQLMGIALDLERDNLGLDQNYVKPGFLCPGA